MSVSSRWILALKSKKGCKDDQDFLDLQTESVRFVEFNAWPALVICSGLAESRDEGQTV
jgi:hypothetical protein